MKRKYLWKTINIIDVGPVHSLGLQLILISFNLINHLVYEMSKKKKKVLKYQSQLPRF